MLVEYVSKNKKLFTSNGFCGQQVTETLLVHQTVWLQVTLEVTLHNVNEQVALLRNGCASHEAFVITWSLWVARVVQAGMGSLVGMWKSAAK